MSYLFENEFLGFKKTSVDDLDDIITLETQEENKRYIISGGKEQHHKAINNEDELHLLVMDKKINSFIGFVMLAGLKGDHLNMELRRIVIDVKGKGYGRSVLQFIKAYCFKVLRFHKLWLDVFDFNERGLHLYKSEGFTEEGRLREHIRVGNEYKTLVLLSILANEYKSSI